MYKKLPVLVIPAYNPDETLIALLNQHQASYQDQHCIIVNDGSDQSAKAIFESLENQGFIVLHHENNQGKGAALKTAMHYFLEHFAQSSPGIITADADGQHCAEDIAKLGQMLQQEPHKLHLGTRQLSQKNIPFRNKLGNAVTKFLFNKLTKNSIQDTQTGLRGIPTELIKHLILSSSMRYEFEFEMLFITNQRFFIIKQTPIKTIYMNNEHSHFRPIRDSLKIYSIFVWFCLNRYLRR